MSTVSENNGAFKEYEPLGPKHRTREHYLIIILHLMAAIVIVWIQYSMFSMVLPTAVAFFSFILIVINGFLYSTFENDAWYRDEMVPYVSRKMTTTAIETDRLRRFHRKLAQGVIILGWLDVLLCLTLMYFGIILILPSFSGEGLIIRVVGELVAYVIVFGPFFLYFGLLIVIVGVLETFLKPRYDDISHLIEFDKKWNYENQRRAKAKDAKSKSQVENDT
jgi:uncharacterized membrane protein